MFRADFERLRLQIDQLAQSQAALAKEIAALRTSELHAEAISKVKRKRLARTSCAASITALLAAVLFMFVTVKLLREPSVTSRAGDAIISLDRQVSAEPFLTASVLEGNITYDIWFPIAFAGTTYTFSLWDAAALGQPHAGSGVQIETSPGLTNFTGKVPLQHADSGRYTPDCGDIYENADAYSLTSVSGKIYPLTDWPFLTASTPSFFVQYRNAIPNTTYAAPLERQCDTVDVPHGYSAVSISPQARFQSDDKVAWTGSNFGDVAVFRRTYAIPVANLSIILAGIAFAVTAGFLPMWIDNRTSRHIVRRSYRRLRRIASSSQIRPSRT